ncbi:DNA-(apurinic or apyrimidinic site) lyase [Basidiobolus ranarum]|uniref:DNA-(Apurinic or apyrimidinic site) lyase n=1 Tax=Basidiobolus ranarum TaxID=34480 RepID=A0ABR2WIW2_9FUNG
MFSVRRSQRLSNKERIQIQLEESESQEEKTYSQKVTKRTTKSNVSRQNIKKARVKKTDLISESVEEEDKLSNNSAQPKQENKNLLLPPEKDKKVSHKTMPSIKSLESVTPLLLRNFTAKKLVGAHVSAAKGVYNSIYNAHQIGGQAFALFLKSQRKWNSPEYTEEQISTFHKALKNFTYSSNQILPHGSYLVNLGNPDGDKRDLSYKAFLDDLKRCEQLGLKLYNFHPGSTIGKCTSAESIHFIADGINKAHQETKSVVCVLENMAGSGNVIGSKFEELRSIIDLVKDKARVGVCLDTCHAFAAGYDLRTKETYKQVMDEFEKVVGFKYLRGLHLNDSKTELGSKKDRHELIGKGYIGLDAFKFIMNDVRLDGIPMVLETPFSGDAGYAQEIELLYSLVEK